MLCHLVGLFHCIACVLDTKLIYCDKNKANYAYVHLPNYKTALRVVDAVHNKMEINSNLLRAVVKGDQQDRPTDDTTLGKNFCDQNLVELHIYDQEFNVSEEELKDHFTTKYGDFDSTTTVYEGHPRLLHMHYTSALSAHAARYDSPHCIGATTVIALPLPGTKEGECENNFTTKAYSCDHLIIEQTEEALTRELNAQPNLKILVKKGTIVVHIQGEIDTQTEKKILQVIRECESEISQVHTEHDFYCLPILADQEIQKQILDFKTPYDLKISRGRLFVTLRWMGQNWRSGLVTTPSVRPYLSSSTSKKLKIVYQWYWKDDSDYYQIYTKDVNLLIEKHFESKTNLMQEIGRYVYIINCKTMTQTNTSTQKSRPLLRKPIQSVESLVLNLQLRAHRDQIPDLKRTLSNLIARYTTTAKVEVPDMAFRAHSFQIVLEKLKKNLVKVTLDSDKTTTVFLQGKEILVKRAEVELHKEILAVVADKSFQVVLPSTWELQSSKCELISVVRETQEWKYVEENTLEPNFRIRIIKIERIQNTWLWELYQLSKKRMSEKNNGEVNEKMLFHGTRQTPPKDIYDSEQGFDNRLASKGRWGEGTYFAASAKYSNAYCHTLDSGDRQMFLAQVIAGFSCELSLKDSTLKAPPKKEEWVTLLETAKFEGERYDSVNGLSNNSKVYVIYELGRVYPAYLITYRKEF